MNGFKPRMAPRKLFGSEALLKRALEEAIGRVAPAASPEGRGLETEDDVTDDIYAEAVQETTQRLVHELEPILGTLRYYAGREIPSYAGSRTEQELARLESLLRAIATLSRAAAPPGLKEVNLAALVENTSKSASVGHSSAVQLVGRSPLIVLGDPSLIEVALANGLRNAIEASESAGAAAPIIVTWDETDTDYYVVVLDRGPGLPLGADNIFEIGETTKKGHLGMGLALADRAVRTMKGKTVLSPREGGGVSYEFRWPKPEARVK